MTELEQKRLLQYEKYLKEDSDQEIDKADMLDLCEFCTINDLCITEIPSKKTFTNEMLEVAKRMHPYSFMDMYQDEIFVDTNDKPVDLKEILLEHNQHRELVEALVNHEGKTTKVITKKNSKDFLKKCKYLADECGLPEYMGELILSEIKNGDKTMPNVINKAVNIGLLPVEYYISNE
jgi:hypothetical protein